MRARSSASGGVSDAPTFGSISRAGSAMPMIGCSTAMMSAASVDRRRALLDQPLGAFGARIERRAGHGKDFAALLGGQPRRDQ